MIYRCPWCEKDDLYRNYHDNERGNPVHDDQIHFEFLLLESFQAGLSWYTILQKRENFRQVFDSFDPHLIAKYDENKVIQLLQDEGIVRHRGKITAAIANARCFLVIQKEFGSRDSYIRGFTDGQTIDNQWDDYTLAPSQTTLSMLISKDLKKRGMKFVGPTTIYSYLQAVGIVNDHENKCWKKGRALDQSSSL